VRVVAYDDEGNPVNEKEIHTAGAPHHIELTADRNVLTANGEDISFVTATIVDKNGNTCPMADIRLSFNVSGMGSFKAVCNGDPTSLELLILVQSGVVPGNVKLTVVGKGLKEGTLDLQVR
jgi:beta-galactosidase